MEIGLKLQNPGAPSLVQTVPDNAGVNVTLENIQNHCHTLYQQLYNIGDVTHNDLQHRACVLRRDVDWWGP